MFRSIRRIKDLRHFNGLYGVRVTVKKLCLRAVLPGLWLGAVLGAGATGFLLGQKQPDISPFVVIPASYQEPDSSIFEQQAVKLGQLKAEIIALRVLFARLAEVANLDDGEFDLDEDPFEFSDKSSPIDDSTNLLIEQFEPINKEAVILETIFMERRIAHDHRISGRPLLDGHRSSGYGYRVDPVTGIRAVHRGVDFIAKEGTPIYALADGVVTFSGTNGDYGNLVEIEHGSSYRTRYAHNKANLVEVGDRVAKSQMIATLGSTGKSTGAHVHVEVRHKGRAVDPAIFIR